MFDAVEEEVCGKNKMVVLQVMLTIKRKAY